MRILYNAGIYLYLTGIFIYSLFDSKAKLWIDGRKDIFNQLKSKLNNNKEKIAWFHSASLGEFEQGRTVIEKFKDKYPDYKILLTFFSPSGFEIRKNYQNADYIFYLPIDTPANAKRFVEIVKPKVVFFIKYEFWFNYLNTLKDKAIPIYLISGIFRPSQHFFKPYGNWFRKQLSCFTFFFVQNNTSKELLNKIGYNNVLISGDTRFDRVSAIADQKKSFPLIEQFKGNNNKLILAGSTWEPDEDLIIEAINLNEPGIKYVIAPHETHNERIVKLKEKLGDSVILFSQANKNNIKDAKVIIIDGIGYLSHIYQYADIAIIGGGFGKGIHNILEAATFGVPIIFGPNYTKFTEAVELNTLGGAYAITNKNEFNERLNLLISNDDKRQMASNICKDYVNNNIGASDIILNNITF